MTNNETINGRIEKMAAWAKEVNSKLASLENGLRDYHQRAIDPVANEITEIWNSYDNLPAKIQQLKFDLIELEMAATNCKENVTAIEDETGLNVAMQINDKGKLIYSNEMARKAAIRDMLRKNEVYSDVTQKCRSAEQQIRRCKAEIEYHENKMSEFGRRNRALVARIEYATAIIKGGQ